MVALFVVLTIVAFLVADGLVVYLRRRKARAAAPAATPAHLAELLPEPDVPQGVFLAPSHLWVGLLPAGEARIGLDALVQSVLGPPDRVEGPVAGTAVRKGAPLFVARWGSRSVTFLSPLAGTVLETAEAGGTEGWVVRVDPEHAWADLHAFPMAEEARRWFSREWSRLREFATGQAMPAPAMALPDGGSPAPGWLRHEPDATWNSFVEEFLKG